MFIIKAEALRSDGSGVRDSILFETERVEIGPGSAPGSLTVALKDSQNHIKEVLAVSTNPADYVVVYIMNESGKTIDRVIA